MVYSNGILPAPRFGLAWDPFGDGKTAIRGGAASSMPTARCRHARQSLLQSAGHLQSHRVLRHRGDGRQHHRPAFAQQFLAHHRSACQDVTSLIRPTSASSAPSAGNQWSTSPTSAAFGRHLGEKRAAQYRPLRRGVPAAERRTRKPQHRPQRQLLPPLPGLQRHSPADLRGQFQLPFAAGAGSTGASPAACSSASLTPTPRPWTMPRAIAPAADSARPAAPAPTRRRRHLPEPQDLELRPRRLRPAQHPHLPLPLGRA